MSSQDPNKSPVYLSVDDDPEMEQAIKRARGTFRYFWRELSWERRRIIPGLDLACVKVAFSDPPGPASDENVAVEQMWIGDVDFDGKQVSGTLINSPNWLTSVSEGDDVQIQPNRVSDWMYAINGRVYGAYTVNLMRSRMSRGERLAHDKAWGLDFGDPNEIQIVPPEYLGQKRPGLFARLLGSGQRSQDPAEVAKKEHPMALNMTESLEEFVQQDPSNLTVADDHGFTLLHQLALAGAASGVAILLRHGADPSALTNHGMTPLGLAKSLGWKKVADMLSAAVTD